MMFKPIEITIQSKTGHTQNQNVPQVHSWATGLLFVSSDLLLEHLKNLLIDFWCEEDPLLSGQDRRQFVPALEWDLDLLDRRLPEL